MRSSLRLLLCTVIALTAPGWLSAAPVSPDQARNLAVEFMSSRAYDTRVIETSPIYTAENAGTPLYYVFNTTDGGAFVIISGEDSTVPVLGYSFESGYYPGNLPHAMQWMMEGLQREIKVAPQLQSSYSSAERQRMARAAGVNATEILLNTPNWSQEGPFNNLIPGRPLVGCVGTAMGTIMKYYSWPTSGNGSLGGVDFNSVYDWDSMRMDNYRSGYTETEATAVATLMYHASKSIDTQYTMSGSSAYEVRVPWALTSFFGYDPGVSYKKRAEVSTQEEWDNLVKAEIEANRPVLYCGQDVTAGHAFVCDGYQGEYLHINWGWGGSANGYYLSTALNPTVSRTHNYNNLNTIVYNIKPQSGNINNWSPLHITSDGNQVGIGSDMTDLSDGQPFKVRVGNIKNLSYDNFAGKVAVALTSADGTVKSLLSQEQNLSLQSLQTLNNGYIDFSNCKLPGGITVSDEDVIRIVTRANGSEEWLPVAGELITANLLMPNNTPATFNIELNGSPVGATMEGAGNVIRGWDYKFKAVLSDPDNDVLTVKANGFVLTPDANDSYTITNVRENQLISLIVQKASEVKEKRSMWVGTAGTLSSIISEVESGTIKDLTLFGVIDATDFAFMRDKMQLKRIDLSGVSIVANGTNQANAIPREAFRGCNKLEEVVLPNSINRLNNGCFRQCGIKKIVIPANVKTYEYNVFCAASALRDIWVGRETAEFINWCVLSGVKVDQATLHVPSDRAWTNYNKAENWNTIKNIIVDPIPPSTDALLAVQEDNNVMFESSTPTGTVTRGTAVNFTADYIADNDNRMEVYANSTLLTPNADGIYTTTVNGNTIIHFNLVAPIAVDEQPSKWKLTDANGSIGMLTEAINVIPGQGFTVRLNALDIPEYYDQLYWGIALTDANNNIKEFISPVNVWSAGVGKNHKLNVNCIVNDSKVREGNKLRVVTSVNKRNWNVVTGSTEDIVDALPAINNMNPTYNIIIPDVEGVNVTGAVATAIRGKEVTIKMVPVNPAYRLNIDMNGEPIARNTSNFDRTFIALSDMEFDIEVFDPKAGGVAEFTVAPGTFHIQLTEENVAETVILHGQVYSLDLQAATGKDCAINTIKTLDLRDVTIVQDGGYAANEINHQLFNPTSTMPNYTNHGKAVVKTILFPDNVVRVAKCFENCPEIEEVNLPLSLRSIPRADVSTGKYGLDVKEFEGCNNLKTIYLMGTPQQENGRYIVAHFNPGATTMDMLATYYDLGHPDSKKVTLIVPQEFLNVYRTAYKDYSKGNPWKYYGYNILSEYPVYGLLFDQSRIDADEDLDLERTASFLGDDVYTVSKTIEGKIRLHNPETKCKVFDNGNEVTLAEDGTIPVTFYNPAKNESLSGNHELSVVYLYDVNFTLSSPLFHVEEPVVMNETDYETASFNTSEDGNMNLADVAENSTVKFKVGFTTEHTDGLELHVMLGQQQLEADEEGFYQIAITNADCNIDIYAVPGEGAVLNAEELESIHPEDAASVNSIALSGEMTPDQLSHAMEMFYNLENLDLSELEGELPENAFAGLENLTQVTLPEVETISEGLFNGCSSLETIEIPASVNIIGADAFKGCESLENIMLTGITEIGDGAFDGCTSMTSITLLSDSENHNGASKPRRTQMSEDALKGLNPNCIIVLDEGVTIPTATSNYLVTTSGLITETQPDGTTIEREGRIYSAGGNMAFIAGYPLAIPHAFNVSAEQEVSLTAQLGEATPLTIPFDVMTVKGENGKEITITIPVTDENNNRISTGGAENEEEINFFGADPESEVLLATTDVKANIPYVVTPFENGDYTFITGEGKVPATPHYIVTEGNEFELHATYKAIELPAADTYMLDQKGIAFERGENDDQSYVEVAPFNVYATSNSGLDQILTGIPTRNIITGVEDLPEIDHLKIYRNGDNLIIVSPNDMELKVYTLEGRIAKIYKLSAGYNHVESLAPGVYLIDNIKVIL